MGDTLPYILEARYSILMLGLQKLMIFEFSKGSALS